MVEVAEVDTALSDEVVSHHPVPIVHLQGEKQLLPPFLQSCYILWLARDFYGILLKSKFIAGSYLPKKLKINELCVAHIEKNCLKKEIYYSGVLLK